MSSLAPRTSLQRSARTRTRKHSISLTTDTVCPVSRSSTLVRRKTRPPPLQIIPELAESEPGDGLSPSYSPSTARPMSFPSEQLHLDPSRVTLSAFTFSIDDALVLFGNDVPGSPALSASSSTSGASSEDVPATPGMSDDEDVEFVLHTPRFRPHCISIRPLCINKTHSVLYPEDEESHSCPEMEEQNIVALLSQTEVKVTTPIAEQDFYALEFGDFISLSPVASSHSPPARRDSFTLTGEVLSVVIDIVEPKPRGQSRHSKPLPVPPPATPPISSFPSMLLPLVQTTAHNSVVRRKRNIRPIPSYPPPPPPAESRPLPRTDVPLDIDDCVFPDEDLVDSSHGSVDEQVQVATEEIIMYSQPSLQCIHPPTSTHTLSRAILEAPLDGMTCDDMARARSSIDDCTPRSSTDSSVSSSYTSNAFDTSFAFAPSSFFEDDEDESEAAARMRSRWSSSTLGSLVGEPSRTTNLLSPLKSVLGSRIRRTPAPKASSPPPPSRCTISPKRTNKNWHGFSSASSTPQTTSEKPAEKPVRRQRSRSSMSSTGTNTSESDGQEGTSSPSRLKRKPIPVAMFLRATP